MFALHGCCIALIWSVLTRGLQIWILDKCGCQHIVFSSDPSIVIPCTFYTMNESSMKKHCDQLLVRSWSCINEVETMFLRTSFTWCLVDLAHGNQVEWVQLHKKVETLQNLIRTGPYYTRALNLQSELFAIFPLHHICKVLVQ